MRNKTEICAFYLENRCKFGNQCFNLHPKNYYQYDNSQNNLVQKIRNSAFQKNENIKFRSKTFHKSGFDGSTQQVLLSEPSSQIPQNRSNQIAMPYQEKISQNILPNKKYHSQPEYFLSQNKSKNSWYDSQPENDDPSNEKTQNFLNRPENKNSAHSYQSYDFYNGYDLEKNSQSAAYNHFPTVENF